MAKTRMRSKDISFDRKARLAQRPERNEDDFNARLDWLNRMEVEDDEIADEISSPITNAAY